MFNPGVVIRPAALTDLESLHALALSAGLDPDGEHPGQLLVELKDKATQQVFVRYYVPSEQVVKAAAQSPDQPMSPGSLLQEKA